MMVGLAVDGRVGVAPGTLTLVVPTLSAGVMPPGWVTPPDTYSSHRFWAIRHGLEGDDDGSELSLLGQAPEAAAVAAGAPSAVVSRIANQQRWQLVFQGIATASFVTVALLAIRRALKGGDDGLVGDLGQARRLAPTTRGWRQAAPRTRGERERLLSRCGPGAFLDPKRLAYPVMAKSGPCVIDCRGLRSAKAKAAQRGQRPDLVRKADRFARVAACGWAP